jgi:hypothetical protein
MSDLLPKNITGLRNHMIPAGVKDTSSTRGSQTKFASLFLFYVKIYLPNKNVEHFDGFNYVFEKKNNTFNIINIAINDTYCWGYDK